MSWEVKMISDLSEIPLRNGIYKEKEFQGRGQKIINMKELFGFNFIGNQEMKRVDLTDSEKERFLVKEGDLLFARRSLVDDGAGKTSIISNLLEDTTFESSMIRVRLNQKITNPLFYYYYFTSYEGRGNVLSLSTGVNVKGIKGSELNNLQIPFPPLETQKRIASILSTYDDLIENNLKRIKLLEETAQNIYKEWFVNFRFPNYEHTEFDIESGLPVGWEKIKLEEIAKLIHGYAFDAKRFTEEPTAVMVLRMGNFKEKGGLQLDKNVKYISKEYDFREKFKLFAGDLIIVLSDVTRDGRIIGNVGILPDYGIEYALNQRVAKLECEDTIKTYLYCALNSFDFKEHCKPRANGATVLNLKSIDVNEYKTLVPSEFIIESFSAKINPLLKIMENLDLQNQKLKEARDILLPRLMNRTIEV